MKNNVLDFLENVHTFEREQRLFDLQEDGVHYWDAVRLPVLSRLYYHYYSNDEYYRQNAEAINQTGIAKKIYKLLRWGLWLFVNELNFLLFLRKKSWLFLKISRFYHADEKRSYDAVADEIHRVLANDSNAVEMFRNAQTDIIRPGHSYQTFHLYTYRNWYRKKHFRPGKTYAASALLKQYFPETASEDWDTLIQEAFLEYTAEFRFGKRLFKKARPKALFFTGGAKGYTAAARYMGIKTVEIQHSPLNNADLCYAYPKGIDYSRVLSLPEYLLINSPIWESAIDYPPQFIVTGSDYFYQSSKPSKIPLPERRNILFVSDPMNHDLIRNYIDRFVGRNDLSGYRVIFKLHSAETDRFEEACRHFAQRPEVQVILNEKNISRLLDESCATFIIYSTVAYQAVQKGLQVYLLKTGYYEGGYDLFDLPHVELIDMDQDITLETIRSRHISGMQMESVHFFDPFSSAALLEFVKDLSQL